MGAFWCFVWLGACGGQPAVAPDASLADVEVEDSGASLERDATTPSDGADAATSTTLAGRVTYELRTADASRSSWSEQPVVHEGAGMLVRAYHGSELLGEAVTSDAPSQLGAFSLTLPANSPEFDRLVVEARAGTSDDEAAFVVADPGFEAGIRIHGLSDAVPHAKIWSWEFSRSALPADTSLHIPLAAGSAAAHVFAAARLSHSFAAAHYPGLASQPFVVWLGLGTRFTCGTCTMSEPVDALGSSFAHQIWLDGSEDERYWADSVTYHELGHLLMSTVSSPQREGGPHHLGQPTHPGQAFGEGWATFFSSFMRGDSNYLDRQAHHFVSYDLASRTYTSGLPWLRPVPARGVEQMLDENEVAALLWDLYRRLDDIAPLLEALASPRLRDPLVSRGYTRRIWSDPNHIENYLDSGQPHAFLADFLDAMRCLDVTAEVIDGVTDPTAHYPYASEAPLCPEP